MSIAHLSPQELMGNILASVEEKPDIIPQLMAQLQQMQQHIADLKAPHTIVRDHTGRIAALASPNGAMRHVIRDPSGRIAGIHPE